MHESLHRDSGMAERGRAYQDKGLREMEEEGEEREDGGMSLCHDNCDLCYEQGFGNAHALMLSPTLSWSVSRRKERVITNNKAGTLL